MGTRVALTIEKIVAGGDGLAFLDGRAVFIPFVIPGERVVADIVEKGRDWVRASLVELVEPSANRVAPACPLYGECGGCNFQHIDYRHQTEIKAGIVRESFRRIGKVEEPDLALVPSVPFAYRNRFQLHLALNGQPGFKRAGSATVIPADSCPIAVGPIREWLEHASMQTSSAVHRQDFGGERFVIFSPDRTGNSVFVEGRDGDVSARVRERTIRFHIKGFFQSNLYMLDYLVQAALAGLSGETVADLYSGVGTFAAFLADSYRRVVCVEHNQYALEYAKTNVGQKGELHAMSVEDWVGTGAAHGPFDAVVCDPPRSGLEPRARAWLRAARPRAISYISCDPVTCARDVGELVRAGFAVESVKLFDFYPQSSHIELCVRMIAV